jgi:hypothetical protein
MDVLKVLPLVLLAATVIACEEWFEPVYDPPMLPEGRRVEIACFDVNADKRVNGADAAALVDEPLAGPVGAVDIALVADAPVNCLADGGPKPDVQVNEPSGGAATIDCGAGQRPLLLVGVAGGEVNMNNETNAAGVRSLLAMMQSELADAGVQSQPIALAPAVNASVEPHPAMESFAKALMESSLAASPCASLVLVGHSHGALVSTAVASVLERDGYGGRILVTALIDRIGAFYGGDSTSLPQQSPVFNIYQTRDALSGIAIDQPNIENWDATDQEGPENGEKGGSLEPVNHTTIDNSEAVWERIIVEVMERYNAASPQS